MRSPTNTLLPLGEKGRDEGASHPNEAFARQQSIDAFSCAHSGRYRQLRIPRARPLTPSPLSPKGRGE